MTSNTDDLDQFWNIIAQFGIPKLTDFVLDLDNGKLRYNQTQT